MEVNWEFQGSPRLFAGWKLLVRCELKEAGNLVQDVINENQKRWNDAAFKTSVLATSVEIGGVFGIIHNWFTSKDRLSLYRAQARTIFSWDGRDSNNPDNLGILEQQESNLFDTTKDNGNTEMMKVITCGSG